MLYDTEYFKNYKSILITTKELCEKLGVSRSWINVHLRSFGTKYPECKPGEAEEYGSLKWILYNEYEIVQFINDNATFTRQTELINIRDYLSESDLKNYHKVLSDAEKMDDDVMQKYYKKYDKKIKSKKEVKVDEAKYNFLVKHLPNDITSRYICNFFASDYGVKKRGLYPHVQCNYQIKKLSNLHQLQDFCFGCSDEMGYRYIFNNGLIKVSLFGRVWFVKPYDWKNIKVSEIILLSAKKG